MTLVPKREVPVMAERRHDEKVFGVFRGDQINGILARYIGPSQTSGPKQWVHLPSGPKQWAYPS